MQMLVDEVNTPLPGAKAAADSLTELFFTLTLQNVISKADCEFGVLAALSDKYLSKALEAFHNGFSENWTLDGLAKQAGMPRSNFVSKFTQTVSISPGAYMTQWRMNWAATVLIDTEAVIYDIALSTGYQSDAAFCRAFRQQFGITPSEYRKVASKIM